MFSRSRDALLLWSTNTEVNIQLLEVASKELEKTIRLTPAIHQTLMAEYFIFQNSIDLAVQSPEDWGIGDHILDQLVWYRMGEPEVSRRLADHYFGIQNKHFPMVIEEWYMNGNEDFELPNVAILPNGMQSLPMEAVYEKIESTLVINKLLPNVLVLPDLYVQELIDYRLLQVALAIQKFQRNTGLFPNSLEELVPKYLKALPADCFGSSSEKVKGKFSPHRIVVYSVGHDGIDNVGEVDTLKYHGEPPDRGYVVRWPRDLQNEPLYAPKPVVPLDIFELIDRFKENK